MMKIHSKDFCVREGDDGNSCYKEVLVARVHPETLQNEDLPDAQQHRKGIWHRRYRTILDLKRHLSRNGTRITKSCLHLSKQEQRKRFLERIDQPEKNRKVSTANIKERGFWTQYMAAYEACPGATSNSEAPWHVVPADDKDDARLIVSQIILDTLEGLDMAYPVSSDELLAIRKELAG